MDRTAFIHGYVECACWAGIGPDHATGFVMEDLGPEALEVLSGDCDDFIASLDKACLEAAAKLPNLAGHDFFLTRNGHGAGFWDGVWPKPVGLRLSDMAHSQGERHLYVGDDGLIHVA